MGGRLRWGAATLAVVLLAAGCSGDDDSDKADESKVTEIAELKATFIEDETFVDSERAMAGSNGIPAATSRTLVTRIAYPQPLQGKHPLVVFAHGLGGNPARHTDLMTAWAEAGYIVAAPAFPRTNDGQPGGRDALDVADMVNQPGDVSFVIDSMLALDDGPIAGHIDADHIGVAGHSLGGATTYALAENTCCRDDRVDAIMLLAIAPLELQDMFVGDFDPQPLPVLQVVADGDFVYEASEKAYPTLPSPKWYVTLHGGDASRHVHPYEDTPDPADQVVLDVTTEFWNLELGADPEAGSRLEKAASPTDGKATLQRDL